MTPRTPPPGREPGREPEDVLAMGEERDPRWRRLVVPLVVALLAAGAYQLLGRSPSPSDAQDAVAEQAAQPVVVQSWVPAVTRGTENQSAPTVRLGAHRVALYGPGLSQPHRETSAKALGRLDNGWLVALTSRACRDRTDTRQSYGTALASGRFTPWDDATTGRRDVWRSPDGALVLLQTGPRLVLRRPATDRVVAVFRP